MATTKLHDSKYTEERHCLQVNIGVNIISSLFLFPKEGLWWLSFVGNNVPPKDKTTLSSMPKLDEKIIQESNSLYLIKPKKKRKPTTIINSLHECRNPENPFQSTIFSSCASHITLTFFFFFFKDWAYFALRVFNCNKGVSIWPLCFIYYTLQLNF